MEKKDLDALAEAQHEIWSHWMRFMFKQGEFKDEVWVIPKEKIERWERQMNTSFNDLSNEEKESDRKVVVEFLYPSLTEPIKTIVNIVYPEIFKAGFENFRSVILKHIDKTFNEYNEPEPKKKRRFLKWLK